MAGGPGRRPRPRRSPSPSAGPRRPAGVADVPRRRPLVLAAGYVDQRLRRRRLGIAVVTLAAYAARCCGGAAALEPATPPDARRRPSTPSGDDSPRRRRPPARLDRQPAAASAVVLAVLVVGAIGFVLVQGLGDATLFFYNVDEAVAQQRRARRRAASGCRARSARTASTQDGRRRRVRRSRSTASSVPTCATTATRPSCSRPGIPVVLEGRWADDGDVFAERPHPREAHRGVRGREPRPASRRRAEPDRAVNAALGHRPASSSASSPRCSASSPWPSASRRAPRRRCCAWAAPTPGSSSPARVRRRSSPWSGRSSPATSPLEYVAEQRQPARRRSFNVATLWARARGLDPPVGAGARRLPRGRRPPVPQPPRRPARRLGAAHDVRRRRRSSSP